MLVSRSWPDGSAKELLESGVGHRIVMDLLRRALDQEVWLSRSPNKVFRSPARVPTKALQRIEQIEPDIVLLHWLGSRMMSVRQIGQIQRPTAWVLHDSWAFCGAEHHPHGDTDRRFVDGYRRDNRLEGEWGIDLNRRVWERKHRHWTRPIQLIAPSNWIAHQASLSALAGDWPVTVIPNPLDINWWGALERQDARQRLGLRQDATVLLFGAAGGDRNPGKGADLLYAALEQVPTHHGVSPEGGPLEVVTFGGKAGTRRVGPHLVRSVGRLDDEGLRAYYSAADVMVVPSRMDNLPQTAVEPISCGTPVVAFRTGGLTDIVDDGANGRLAEPFSPASLASCISWVLESPERHRSLSGAARLSSGRWEPSVIAQRYVELFEEMLSREPRSA